MPLKYNLLYKHLSDLIRIHSGSIVADSALDAIVRYTDLEGIPIDILIVSCPSLLASATAYRKGATK